MTTNVVSPSPDAIRPYPEQMVTHEAWTLKEHLRLHPDCPDEVRISHYEGHFMRDSIVITPITVGQEAMGDALLTLTRSGTITWYGPTASPNDEKNAQNKASWITQMLLGDERMSGALEIIDASTNQGTGDYLTVLSVGANILRDPDNYWVVAVDVRWQTEPSRLPPFPGQMGPQPPFITSIVTKPEHNPDGYTQDMLAGDLTTAEVVVQRAIGNSPELAAQVAADPRLYWRLVQQTLVDPSWVHPYMMIDE